MNLSKSSIRFSFRACVNSRGRCLLLMKSSMNRVCDVYCQESRYCHICQCRRTNVGVQKGNLRVSGGCDDARDGWPVEGHDSLASAGWTEMHQRTEAFHPWDHRAHADSASSGTCCRWHRQKRRQEDDSSLRLLCTLTLWEDARPSGANDVQL